MVARTKSGLSSRRFEGEYHETDGTLLCEISGLIYINK